MNEFELILFDDTIASKWQPFTLTRPAGELLLGAFTARARAERILGVACIGHLAPGLEGFEEEGAPPVIPLDSISTERARLFLNSRALLDWRLRDLNDGAGFLAGAAVARNLSGFVKISDTTSDEDSVTITHAGMFVSAGMPNPSADELWRAAPGIDTGFSIPGRMLANVWDLVSQNPRQIIADYDAFRTHDSVNASERGGQFAAINYKAGDLRLGTGVTIEPNVVLDFTHGPIWLDDGVTIRAFTRLAGPAYVGRDSTLLGGPYDAVSIGPVCRIHGEVEESVILGYSNKAHDGFLGHAYLGRWVNLGAMTTNSDLKNNYGNVRLWTPDGDMDTGTMKMGSLLGDHVKTGIGSLINTGTVVGAGSNLFGTAMPPKYVPPFSWGSGSDLTSYDVDKFLGVAKTAMGRRKVSLGESMASLLRTAWNATAHERDGGQQDSSGTAGSSERA
jgi:UDP-N-acetylglucosamine diphosphorylase/glucosamine-1-phosphate N-acetyltransferase